MLWNADFARQEAFGNFDGKSEASRSFTHSSFALSVRPAQKLQNAFFEAWNHEDSPEQLALLFRISLVKTFSTTVCQVFCFILNHISSICLQLKSMIA